jgi:hypothetical protein
MDHGTARRSALGLLFSSVIALSLTAQADQALIADALKAAPPDLARGATVVDWEGKVHKQGSNGYTCLPTPPTLSGQAPMCLEGKWRQWAEAWQNKKPFEAKALGIAYMLGGDAGASNVDPFAEGPTEDNQWIKEGPHLMVIAPPALLETFTTDPQQGGPYLMWKGTPYQHLMVPVGARTE